MEKVYASKPLAYKAVKRVFDVVSASIALIIMSPIFLVTSIAILIEDGRPIFYTSARAGKDMKTFGMYKFRSMRKNAESELKDLLEKNEQTGRAFKLKEDPRITKVGSVIRKLSIDELPQLLNIIKGDMSVVGPRPILDWQMADASPYEKQRQIVRPGLTCYWQISGRASISWEDWVELDLDYIDDMSLKTDVNVIVRTPRAIVDSEGAY